MEYLQIHSGVNLLGEFYQVHKKKSMKPEIVLQELIQNLNSDKTILYITLNLFLSILNMTRSSESKCAFHCYKLQIF